MTAINMITLWGYGFHIHVGVVIELLMMRWAVFKQFKSVLFGDCDRWWVSKELVISTSRTIEVITAKIYNRPALVSFYSST